MIKRTDKYSNGKGVIFTAPSSMPQDIEPEGTPPKKRKLGVQQRRNIEENRDFRPSNSNLYDPFAPNGKNYSVSTQMVLGSPVTSQTSSKSGPQNVGSLRNLGPILYQPYVPSHISSLPSTESLNHMDFLQSDPQLTTSETPQTTTQNGKPYTTNPTDPLTTSQEEEVIHFSRRRDDFAAPGPNGFRDGNRGSFKNTQRNQQNGLFRDHQGRYPQPRNRSATYDPLRPFVHSNGASWKSRSAKGIPWGQKGQVFKSLSDEVNHFMSYIEPTKNELLVRLDLVERLKNCLTTRFGQSKVAVRFFGSFATNLMLPSSDIDMVVLYVNANQGTLYQVAKWLEIENFCSKPQVISTAKVPIVKFTDTSTQISVDISFDQASGITNSKALMQFSSQFKHFRPLVLFLKFFLFQRSLHEPVNGGLGSYATSLLVVSFLQQHVKLHRNTNNDDFQIGDLLLELLAYYGTVFDFSKTGVSVSGDGTLLSKKSIESKFFPLDAPYIEDPTDDTNDVGRSAYRITQVQHALRDAYLKLSQDTARRSADFPSLLSRVLCPFAPLIQHRAFLSHFCTQKLHHQDKYFLRNTKALLEAGNDPSQWNGIIVASNPYDGLDLSNTNRNGFAPFEQSDGNNTHLMFSDSEEYDMTAFGGDSSEDSDMQVSTADINEASGDDEDSDYWSNSHPPTSHQSELTRSGDHDVYLSSSDSEADISKHPKRISNGKTPPKQQNDRKRKRNKR